MQQRYIAALDQGTTSSRAIIFEKDRIIGVHSRPHQQIYPYPGWVSHNANEIFFNVVECLKRVMDEHSVPPEEIAAIGITNQRETLVAWDKRTGEPVTDAIVWLCRRSSDICRQMKSDGMEDIVRQKTGLLVDPYFTGTKIRWMLDNVPSVRLLLENGNLLVGTVDSFLIWKLTGGKTHVSDYTNASRTMLFNINTLDWDQDLLDYFKIPKSILPGIVPNSGVVGVTTAFGGQIPIAGAAGDQHCALFGQTCFNEGDSKNTYGTGCFILQNIGTKPVISKNGLLTTIAWNIGGKTVYALEGSIFNAGSAIDWLINNARLAVDVREINDFCDSTPDSNGVCFVPAFSGLGAPRWDAYARGVLCGLDLSATSRHIVRAVMEAIAYQTKDVFDAMEADTGLPITKLRVDGGVTKSNFVMQFQSDILNISVERPVNTELTALGASYLAGLAVGYYKDLNEIAALVKNDVSFLPAMASDKREKLYSNWLKAVERARAWVE